MVYIKMSCNSTRRLKCTQQVHLSAYEEKIMWETVRPDKENAQPGTLISTM